MALFLSRIHPKKGLDRLLPVWPKVLARVPDAVLVIAGKGDADYEATLRNKVRELGLDKSVLFVGQLSGENKWQALVAADVFVLPSHQEGFSMAITEAMAAATPVVITAECNFEEAESHDAGRVIENGDMQAFAQSVADYLVSGDRGSVDGRNGWELVRDRYTWEALANQMLAHYRAMAEAGRPLG